MLSLFRECDVNLASSVLNTKQTPGKQTGPSFNPFDASPWNQEWRMKGPREEAGEEINPCLAQDDLNAVSVTAVQESETRESRTIKGANGPAPGWVAGGKCVPTRTRDEEITDHPEADEHETEHHG